MSEPVVNDLDIQPSTASDIPAFASLLAYDSTQYAEKGVRYKLRDDDLENNEREIVPVSRTAGIVGKSGFR